MCNFLYLGLILFLGAGCGGSTYKTRYPDFFSKFGDQFDFNQLPNYANQTRPSYIDLDNTSNNPITDKGALLGRILFYDKSLSSNDTVSCSSCHQQAHAFGDLSLVSTGVNGQTARHSMRLINARFSSDEKFFWDQRADTLEEQSTQPIQDHIEMGFSGTNGDPNLVDLIKKLGNLGYYQDLFHFVYGNREITEEKIQLALGQFIRSIESFDSAYDIGRQQLGNDVFDFPNFSADQNAGKNLFLSGRSEGGAGCAACHSSPEFALRRDSGNNGVIGIFGSTATDTTVTRAPSLRDLVKPDGSSNGVFMHDASLTTLDDVVNHYNTGIAFNTGLDIRLSQGGSSILLGLTTTQVSQIVEFLKTLSGSDVYTNPKWSDPFQ